MRLPRRLALSRVVLVPAPCIAFALIVASTSAFEDPAARSDDVPRRIPWNDSQVIGSPEPPKPYKTVRAFPKLEVKQPLAMLPEPGSNRLFVLRIDESWGGAGHLLAVADDQDADTAEPLLRFDGTAYGLAFHPDYETNGYVYIGLNGPLEGSEKTTQVARYTVDRRSPHAIDPASKLLIIEWPSNGHNGGDLAFGNDGMLYVSSGDGSSDSDEYLTGQRIDDLLGAVMRIDVDHPDPGRVYGVPADNPFVDRPGARPELWAYGLRNPWRLSYDRPSGQLWVGNNGQDLWEQAYLIRKGANYGWSVTEGMNVFRAQREAGPDPISPPAAEHHHSEARSLTGGHVYRGARYPDLVGAYIYGDWSTGRVWGIKHDGERALWHEELVDTPFHITGFGLDHEGEIYIIDQDSGFYRLEPTTEADRPSQPFPTLLSRTGLFADVAAHRPHEAALPYDVIAPQWADGAFMDRFVALPGLERIVQKPQHNAGGSWTFPDGSVLVQTLSLDVLDPRADDDTDATAVRRRIETRLLVRQDGEWAGYSYRWNDDQTDAELVESAGDASFLGVPDPAEPGGVREQVWRFPARSECMICHSRAAGFVLGFTPLQLDRDGTSSDDHHSTASIRHDLAGLERLGVFEGPLPRPAADRPRLADPYDSQAPTEARVRSYLHVNCAICHVSAGGGNSRMELSLGTPLKEMRLVDEEPVHARFDLEDARLVAPGAPERSVLRTRIGMRQSGQMPPLVSNEIDHEAVALIDAWIRSLPPGD